VLELEVVREVAERPDPRDTGLAGVVGADVPVGIDLDSRRSEVRRSLFGLLPVATRRISDSTRWAPDGVARSRRTPVPTADTRSMVELSLRSKRRR